MSMSIQGGRMPASLDSLISEVGLVAAADENAEAQSAQIRAREHRDAANVERSKIEDQRRKLKEDQAKASKPSIFSKALGLVGRAFAAVTTSGYSLIEAALLAKSKNGESFFSRLFGDKANALFGTFALVMAPLAGIPAMIADRKQQSDRATDIFRDQAELETTSVEIDKLRRAMTHSMDVAKTANERADHAREEVERMTDALDSASRAAARSIGG